MARRSSAGRRPPSPAATRTQRRLLSNKVRRLQSALPARYRLSRVLLLRLDHSPPLPVPLPVGRSIFRSSRIPVSACPGRCSTPGSCNLQRNSLSKAGVVTRSTGSGAAVADLLLATHAAPLDRRSPVPQHNFGRTRTIRSPRYLYENKRMVGASGFEPPASWSRTR
jgi:hypothetical protein